LKETERLVSDINIELAGRISPEATRVSPGERRGFSKTHSARFPGLAARLFRSSPDGSLAGSVEI